MSRSKFVRNGNSLGELMRRSRKEMGISIFEMSEISGLHPNILQKTEVGNNRISAGFFIYCS